MTKKQKRMHDMVAYLQHYMNTYSNQIGYIEYSDQTLIDDVLYGLGTALNKEEYKGADGYNRFKKVLVQHIKDTTPEEVKR